MKNFRCCALSFLFVSIWMTTSPGISALKPARIPVSIFTQEAFIVRATQFLDTYSPDIRSAIHREAAMFGRGYTRHEAQTIVAPYVKGGNFSYAKIGKDATSVPNFSLTRQQKRMRAAVSLVQTYYLRSSNPEARKHLKNLQSKTFRFVNLTHPVSPSERWQELIFAWENHRRFLGGYTTHEAVYLPYPLIARLQDIHHEAERRHRPRIKHLSLEILARLVHHESEHLIYSRIPNWEDPQEVRWLMKNLDRLFAAVYYDSHGERYLGVMKRWDSLRGFFTGWGSKFSVGPLNHIRVPRNVLSAA